MLQKCKKFLYTVSKTAIFVTIGVSEIEIVIHQTVLKVVTINQIKFV